MKMMGLLVGGKTIESPKELIKNTKIAIKDWKLGPENVDLPNEKYWAKMAEIRMVDVDEAKRNLCCNCEYYDNTSEMMEAMNEVPLNEYDIYDSKAQRGYCHKLHFICHTPRTCQAWEEKDYEVPDDEEDMMEEY